METQRLVAFEGIDGTGKSTQIERAGAWLRQMGIRICKTFEPTNGQFGRQIRTAKTRLDPELERQLFLDDRREHVQTCILPALERGESVLTDRYLYSSVAYQGLHVPQAQREQRMQAIYEQNLAFAPQPDAILYFDLSVSCALSRMQAHRTQLDPFETAENLTQVRKGYDWVLTHHPAVHRIDASKAEEEVWHEVRAALVQIFGLRI